MADQRSAWGKPLAVQSSGCRIRDIMSSFAHTGFSILLLILINERSVATCKPTCTSPPCCFVSDLMIAEGGEAPIIVQRYMICRDCSSDPSRSCFVSSSFRPLGWISTADQPRELLRLSTMVCTASWEAPGTELVQGFHSWRSSVSSSRPKTRASLVKWPRLPASSGHTCSYI
jgi:hypothetical protein